MQAEQNYSQTTLGLPTHANTIRSHSMTVLNTFPTRSLSTAVQNLAPLLPAGQPRKTRLSQRLKLNETPTSPEGENSRAKQSSQHTPVPRRPPPPTSTACAQTIKKAGRDCLLLLASHTHAHTTWTAHSIPVPSKLPSATHKHCRERCRYSCPHYAMPAGGFPSDNTRPRERQCSRVCNM